MNLAGSTPTVILPVDFPIREFDSKLVLASVLSARGYRSIVGYKGIVADMARASHGITWFGRAGLFSAQSQNHLADALLSNGSAIVYLQEEGAIFPVGSWSNSVLQRHQIDLLALSDISRICLWGERQKETISEHCGELEDRLRVTGTPRLDLCSPNYRWISNIHDDIEETITTPYILACTRFTSIAHEQGPATAFTKKLSTAMQWYKDVDLTAAAEARLQEWRQDVHDFAEFVVLINELAETYPDHTLVLRPHPSEGQDFYREAFSRSKNVVVRKEGNVLDWIRPAELVIHCNCTSGIEAVLAGRPVINFVPSTIEREAQNIEVAREAGTKVSSVEEALAQIAGILRGGGPSQVWSPHAKNMLRNLQAEAIPEVANEIEQTLTERKLYSPRINLPSRRWPSFVTRPFVGTRARSTYMAHRRPPLNRKYIEAVLDGCRANAVGRGTIDFIEDEYVVVSP